MLGNTKALPFNPMHLGIWAAEFLQVCTGQLKVRSQRSDWDIAKTHCICGALAAANTSLVVIRRREPTGEEGAVYGIACKHWMRGDIGKGSIYRNNMKQQHQLQGVPIAWSWVNIRDCTWSDAHCGEANVWGIGSSEKNAPSAKTRPARHAAARRFCYASSPPMYPELRGNNNRDGSSRHVPSNVEEWDVFLSIQRVFWQKKFVYIILSGCAHPRKSPGQPVNRFAERQTPSSWHGWLPSVPTPHGPHPLRSLPLPLHRQSLPGWSQKRYNPPKPQRHRLLWKWCFYPNVQSIHFSYLLPHQTSGCVYSLPDRFATRC